ARELADDHALAAELPDELRRIALGPEGDQTRLVWLRDDLEPLCERRSASRGHLGGALEAPLGSDVQRLRETRERRRSDPAAVEALRALAGDVRAIRLVLDLREVARERDRNLLGPGDYERTRHVR